MKLYWNLFYDKVSTEQLLESNCLIKDWKKDLIEGPIIDIGCGQSKELLTFIDSERELYAVDQEQLQLDFLKRRVIEKAENKINLWHFLKLNIGVDEVPSKEFSLIICMNLLHFFTLKKCISLIESWEKNMTAGTLLYIEVHSDKHPSNNPGNPENNEYFKHYFSKSDLEKLFPNEKFDSIYFSETQRIQTAESSEFINLWLDSWNELNSITDAETIAEDKEEYFKNNRQANFTAIYRKREKNNSH